MKFPSIFSFDWEQTSYLVFSIVVVVIISVGCGGGGTLNSDCIISSVSSVSIFFTSRSGGNILVIGMYSGRLSVFRKPLEKGSFCFDVGFWSKYCDSRTHCFQHFSFFWADLVGVRGMLFSYFGIELWNFECETYLPYPVYTILPLRRKSAFDFGFRSEDVELVDRSLEIRTCLISTRLLVGTLKGVHVFLLTVDEKSSLLQESSSPISS